MKKIDFKRIWRILKCILNIFVTIFIILFLLVVCLQRFSNNRISFFDYRMFTVVSGSMKPNYNVGDVLISKNVDPSKIKVGDDLSYLGRNGDFKDKVVTHRVVDIYQDKDGKYLFKTKGTANILEDPIVYEEQLYGVVVYKSVILSAMYKIVGTTTGMFIFIIIPIFYIVGSEILSAMLAHEEKRRNKD